MASPIPEVPATAETISPETAPTEPSRWYITPGAVILINGQVPLRLVNVNDGKKRLTFAPVGDWPMPVVDDDPVVGVVRWASP